MRTIRQLFEQDKRVWVYLSGKAIGREFMRQARQEGFHWPDGKKLHPWQWFYVLGIQEDLTVWNLSLSVWKLSFRGTIEGTPLRIDYEKYRSGEENDLCEISHFSQTGKTV